jgi:KDO2-lipid IV(A) lauroyltransferase
MKKIRYFFEYLLVKLWLAFTRRLGLERATNFAGNFFQIIGMRLRVTEVAKKNLQLIMPELDSDKVIREVWDNLGRVAAESALLIEMPQAEFNRYIKVIGIENVQKLAGKRILFFAAHLANWEIMGKAFAAYGIKFNVVYREANNKLVDEAINHIRKKIEVSLIPKGRKGVKQIIEAMQKQENMAMLVDQKMNDGVKVEFMGHEAMTAPAIASLALKYNCPIIPVQMLRKNGSNFEMIIHPEIWHNNRSVEEIMNQINEQISHWVKQNPGQWFWLHRRWGKL